MQLLERAPCLTRLELLPTTTWAWEHLGAMPRLRSLSTGCGWEQACQHESLSNLTELRLAFQTDVAMDLSALTRLRVRFSGFRPEFWGFNEYAS